MRVTPSRGTGGSDHSCGRGGDHGSHTYPHVPLAALQAGNVQRPHRRRGPPMVSGPLAGAAGRGVQVGPSDARAASPHAWKSRALGGRESKVLAPNKQSKLITKGARAAGTLRSVRSHQGKRGKAGERRRAHQRMGLPHKMAQTSGSRVGTREAAMLGPSIARGAGGGDDGRRRRDMAKVPTTATARTSANLREGPR